MAAPLVIIPGPKEPKNMEPYMSGVLIEMAQLGPQFEGRQGADL